MKIGKGSRASRRESSTSTAVSEVGHDDSTTMASDDQEGIARGGVATPFPWKLHEMLEDSSKEGNEWIVSWQSHGRSFLVHKPKLFVEKIMPTYFNQSKFASFQRQLNLYGFSRLTTGKDKGAYYHSCFIRGHRGLCRGMVRQKIKGTKVRRTLAPEEEPDFYKMTNTDVDMSSSALPPLSGVSDDPAEVVSESPVVERRQRSGSAYETEVTSAKERALKLRQDRLDAVRDALKQTESFCNNEEAFQEGRKHMSSVPSVSPMDSEESDSEDSNIAMVTPSPHQTMMKMCSFPQPPFGDAEAFPVLPTFEEMTQDPLQGGDLLFFEGKPFHYLEHLDSLPPPPPKAVAALPPKAKQGPAQAYSNYTPRDSLQSLMRADPQALMGAAFGARYTP